MNEDDVILASKVVRALSLSIIASGAPPVPDWFEPVMSRPRPKEVYANDTVETTYNDIHEAIRAFGLAGRRDIYIKNEGEIREWMKEKSRQALTQWPAAYAKEVLRALGRGEE